MPLLPPSACVGVSIVDTTKTPSGSVACFMCQHMRDNGLDCAARRLVHGTISTRDGIARFPRLAESRNEYRSQASYGVAIPTRGMVLVPEMEEVSCWSLGTLLVGLDHVDLLHCDIQGMGGAVFVAVRATVDAKVCRAVTGTHFRAGEDEPLQTFGDLGWMLEDETVCRLQQGGNGPFHLVVDGCQVWFNPRLGGAA